MALSDDQKAMLRLLAQREQGYDDLAALMGLSVDEVRAKVKDALAQLEEQGETPAAAPVERPASAPVEAAPSAPVEPTPVVEVPPAAEPARAAAPAPPASAPAAGSGGATMRKLPPKLSIPSSGRARAAIAAGALALIAVVVVLALGGGDSNDTTAAAGGEATTAEEASGRTAPNSSLTQAVLSPVGDGNGSGVAVFGRIKKNVVLQVEAKGLGPSPQGSSYTVWLYKSPLTQAVLSPVGDGPRPFASTCRTTFFLIRPKTATPLPLPSPQGSSYTVWLYKSPQLALRIGSVEVTKSGGIAAQFPVPTELLAYVASGAFDQIDLSLTSNATYEAEITKAKKEKRLPRYTGEDVLRGKITGPAIEAAAKKNAE
jgi:hypothetical protein